MIVTHFELFESDVCSDGKLRIKTKIGNAIHCIIYFLINE